MTELLTDEDAERIGSALGVAWNPNATLEQAARNMLVTVDRIVREKVATELEAIAAATEMDRIECQACERGVIPGDHAGNCPRFDASATPAPEPTPDPEPDIEQDRYERDSGKPGAGVPLHATITRELGLHLDWAVNDETERPECQCGQELELGEDFGDPYLAHQNHVADALIASLAPEFARAWQRG